MQALLLQMESSTSLEDREIQEGIMTLGFWVCACYKYCKSNSGYFGKHLNSHV